MKILLATDYSKHAGIALQYAVDIACTMDVELHALHVHNNYVYDEIYLGLEEEAFKDAENAMSELMAGVLPLLKTKHIPQFNVIAGDTKQEIMTYIEEEEIDLLIVGTEGKKNINNLLFGSTAKALVNNVNIPILVIPEHEFTSLNSKSILLALDNREVNDESIFHIPNAISKAYDMSYNILHVKKEDADDFPFDPIVLNYVTAPLSEIEIYENKSVVDGINSYVSKDNKTGLIIMIKREEGFIKSLFSISQTSKEIFNTPTPLLILKN